MNRQTSAAAGAALLFLSASLLSGCGGGSGGASGSSSDPYAGLDPQILAWRTSIEAEHPACARKVDGKGCEVFEVRCKGSQALTAQDTQNGVTARVVAAMTFSGRGDDGAGKPGSAFAVFSKTGGTWSRAETGPVNLKTCAPL